MKIWKSLLVLLFLALVAWGTYEAYQKYAYNRSINSLELISSDAIFVFETKQADQTWKEVLSHPLWLSLSQFPAFQTFQQHWIALDSLSGEEDFVSKTLRNKQVTISYQAEGKDDFSLLYTINFGSESPLEFLESLKPKVPKTSRLQSRTYSEQEIIDVIGPNNSIQWSITSLNNVLLISSSSFAIEEAIRFYLSDSPNRLSEKIIDPLSQDSGLGRLIISSKGIAKLLKGVSQSQETMAIQELESFDHYLALTLYLEENQLLFKGPMQWREEVQFLPSVQAQLSDFESLISTRSLSITQINLKDGYETQKLKNSAFVPISTVSGEIQSRLIDRGFFDYLSGEQYLLNLEPLEGGQENLALLVKSSQIDQAWNFLQEYRDTTEFNPVERYLENEILFFPEENFPAHLFNGKFAGFQQTYISRIGDILLMSNSAAGMKVLLDDHFQGETWDKKAPGPDQKLLLPSSGYSKIILLNKLWPTWTQLTNPTWSTFLQKYAAALQSFTTLSFRINQSTLGPEASLSLRYNAQSPGDSLQKKSFDLIPAKEVSFSKLLGYGPKAIKNFNDGSEDLVLQDLSNTLYLINSAGEQVFDQVLDSPIVSEAFQIDFYKNGKLQLLVATANYLYGIDRLGESLPGFPVKLQGEKITHLNLLDYDQNREYRYFISTEQGNLWLLDKSGKALEGWNPLALGETSIGPPFHLRVSGKGDFMVALGSSGKIHLFNRRGEIQAGSPVVLKEKLRSPLVINKSTTPPTLYAISDGGEVSTITFSGETLKTSQFLKTNRDDRFTYLPDQKGTSFLILLQQFNKIQFLSEHEKSLLTVPISGGKARVGYFNFGPDRKLIAVTDLEKKMGYLYDLSGNLVISSPMPSEGEIQLSHRPELSQYFIRTRVGTTVYEFVIPD
ncbi:MAG: hypothetical protein ACKO44_08685 [Algoriphagus sp.]